MAISSGFNSTKVTAAINGINKAHASLMRVLVDGVNNQVVTPMSNAWACQNAVDFFQEFKTRMDELVQKSDSTLQSVVDTLNQAGINWAAKTGNEGAFSKIPFTNYSGRISVDSIKENINDDRGADPAATRSTLAVFQALTMNADSSLTLVANAVRECGFLGGAQQANLTASINTIKKDIKETFDSLLSQSKEKINESIEQYGELEAKTAETFTVSE